MRKHEPTEHGMDGKLETGQQCSTPPPPSRPGAPSWLVLVRFYAYQVLGMFNPRMAFQLLRQAVGQMYAVLGRLRARERVAVPVQVRLPVDGAWRVHRGGTDRAHSHSWYMLAQRFAYDFTQGPEQPPRGARGRVGGISCLWPDCAGGGPWRGDCREGRVPRLSAPRDGRLRLALLGYPRQSRDDRARRR